MDRTHPAETRLLHSLVSLAGRRPHEFRLRIEGERMAVFGAVRMSSYPLECWTSAFLRHLHGGYFDRQPRSLQNRPQDPGGGTVPDPARGGRAPAPRHGVPGP